MKFIEINWTPTDRQLRQFGLTALVALPGLGWLWGAGPRGITGLLSAGIAAAILGWIGPRILRPAFVGLSLLTFPIGAVVSELTLLVMFYGVFLPVGLLFRVLGRDPLEREFNRQSTSYWAPKRQSRGVAGYFRLW
ncbi:MAG: SxtJ family membrane protein [Deltaproteobacteria bacterium]